VGATPPRPTAAETPPGLPSSACIYILAHHIDVAGDGLCLLRFGGVAFRQLNLECTRLRSVCGG
jgi:hypothetical protein